MLHVEEEAGRIGAVGKEHAASCLLEASDMT